MIWCKLLVTSDEVWKIRTPAIIIMRHTQKENEKNKNKNTTIIPFFAYHYKETHTYLLPLYSSSVFLLPLWIYILSGKHIYYIVCYYYVPDEFRVNLHSEVTWMSRNSLLETGAISKDWVIAIWLKPTTT